MCKISYNNVFTTSAIFGDMQVIHGNERDLNPHTLWSSNLVSYERSTDVLLWMGVSPYFAMALEFDTRAWRRTLWVTYTFNLEKAFIGDGHDATGGDVVPAISTER